MAHPAKKLVEFCAQRLAVEPVEPHIQSQNDVQRLQFISGVTEGFTRQPFDQVAVVGALQKALRHHDSEAGTFGSIQPDKTMMNHEVTTALRTPQSKNG